MREVKIPKERLIKVTEAMCDDYCRWPTQAIDQAQLDRFCNDCPLNIILIDELWDDNPLGTNNWQE